MPLISLQIFRERHRHIKAGYTYVRRGNPHGSNRTELVRSRGRNRSSSPTSSTTEYSYTRETYRERESQTHREYGSRTSNPESQGCRSPESTISTPSARPTLNCPLHSCTLTDEMRKRMEAQIQLLQQQIFDLSNGRSSSTAPSSPPTQSPTPPPAPAAAPTTTPEPAPAPSQPAAPAPSTTTAAAPKPPTAVAPPDPVPRSAASQPISTPFGHGAPYEVFERSRHYPGYEHRRRRYSSPRRSYDDTSCLFDGVYDSRVGAYIQQRQPRRTRFGNMDD